MTRQVLALALCRVSSTEQLENNSLNRQREAVLQAAQELNLEIPDDGWWSGSVSSKRGTNINRRDLQEMLERCRRDKKIKYIIVDEVDRFMRSMLELGYFIVEFKKLGVKLLFASQRNLTTETATDTLLLMLEAFKAEGSNEERQRKSISGQTKAILEGRYPFVPKPGYMRGYERGIPVIHPERGPALQKVLKRLAAGLVSPTQALIELNQGDFTKSHAPYKMDKFEKIAIDPFYAGIVEIHKQVDVRNENGLHEPLITRDEHKSLLLRMAKRPKYQSGPNRKGNPKYPLNNSICHDACVNGKNGGRIVGYDHGNGQNKNLVYQKYRCRTCNKYWNRSDVHEDIIRMLKQFRLEPEAKRELITALEEVWKQNDAQIQQEITRMNGQISSIRATISQKVEAATDSQYEAIRDEILEIVASKKAELEHLESTLNSLTLKQESDQREFMEFALDFIENASHYYLEEYVSRESRLKCKQLLFPAGIMINQDGKVYTTEISLLYRVNTNKKDAEASDNSHLVRVRGL